MSNDDDELGFDLSAWEVPPVRGDLAETVIARLGAVETTTTSVTAATAMELDRPRRRLVIAGVATAVVAAAAGAWLVVRTPHEAEVPASGAILAERARHLELDKISADLDLGADVRWHKTRDAMQIEQRGGAATWRIATETRVVIDAGAGGKATGAAASIEATGASLRVEIQPMTMSDARVIGASALTSAAVAMITVVVYEGHVKATSAGQTIVVQPGSSVEIRPDQPPREPLRVGLAPAPAPGQAADADLAIAAGESITIHDPDGTTAVQIHGSCAKDTEVAFDPANVSVHPDGVIAVPAGHYRYEVRCDGSVAATAAGTIDVVRDPGLHAPPEPPAMNTIDADGRKYRITYQAQIPPIQVRASGTAQRYTLIVARGAETRRYTANGTGKSSMTFMLDHATLTPGTYALSYELDGTRAGQSTELVLELDTSTSIASIDQPVNGDRWSSPVHISGRTIPGASVTAIGRGIIVDGEQRFAGDLELGSNALALRVVHPDHGTHYYIRRAGSHEVTVAKIGNCDEVSCVLNNYEGACCARFPHPTPAELTPAQVTATIDAAKSEVMACGASHAVGIVKVDVHVAPDGTVSKADVLSTPDPEVGVCVGAAISKLRFDATKRGGNTTYTLAFAGTAPPSCDADALRDEGTQAESMGRHTIALQKFDASYTCKPDSHTNQLAFLAACNLTNLFKARKYWAGMTAEQRQRTFVMCVRNGITREQLDAPAPAETPAAATTEPTGTLHLECTPPARVYIDGKDTGLTTPVMDDKLVLSPGRHKVTFKVGEDRYTWPVTIEAGKTELLSKDLQ